VSVSAGLPLEQQLISLHGQPYETTHWLIKDIHTPDGISLLASAYGWVVAHFHLITLLGLAEPVHFTSTINGFS